MENLGNDRSRAKTRGKGMMGHWNERHDFGFIPLPNIPLPITLLDGPPANAGRLE
jgi:hypothetical protein